MKDWDNFHHTAYRKVRISRLAEGKPPPPTGSTTELDVYCKPMLCSPKNQTVTSWYEYIK